MYHEKDTLLYRVFQPEYFPNGRIFDVEITPHCSFAWKSILQTRVVICKGARWWIGNGTTIDIWGHRWIDDMGGGLIVSPQRDLSLKFVHDLFIPGTQLWDEELIDINFIPLEANCIKSIPVSFRTSKNLLIWPPNPRWLLYGEECLYDASHGLSPCLVPNKVRHFMWRASGEALPTRSNLKYRYVLVNGTCNLCEDHPKDAMHCLWICDHGKCIWLSDPTFNFPRARHFNNFCDLVSFVLSEVTSSTAALFAKVAWCIWGRRNKLRKGQQVWDVGETIQRAQDLLQEF
nr:uncharacterized protein LOC112029645 [Quercus suber]